MVVFLHSLFLPLTTSMFSWSVWPFSTIYLISSSLQFRLSTVAGVLASFLPLPSHLWARSSSSLCLRACVCMRPLTRSAKGNSDSCELVNSVFLKASRRLCALASCVMWAVRGGDCVRAPRWNSNFQTATNPPSSPSSFGSLAEGCTRAFQTRPTGRGRKSAAQRISYHDSQLAAHEATAALPAWPAQVELSSQGATWS